MRSDLEFKRWLIELDEELLLSESEDLHIQAIKNIAYFGLTEAALAELCTNEIEDFLIGCYRLYEKKNLGDEKVFYCWLDEMAGQIRTSAVSTIHGKLPFGIQLQLCTSLELANSIKSMDSGSFTKGKLKVWQNGI
ncbi:hypothetical protein [Alteromonas sp. BMJM2]|uniref:hypothetical protein n=1 Tax=Alteromonas sp. BMJM2 TaxID=2954241 RepID=UPI0022B46698|nr:hypothetical protein [Alteromonas sp. BMJM2]